MGGGVVRGAGRGGPEGWAAEGAGEERAGKESGEEDAEGEDEGGGVVIQFHIYTAGRGIRVRSVPSLKPLLKLNDCWSD